MQNFRKFCRLSKIYEINFGIRVVLGKLTLNYVAINLAKKLTYILGLFFLSSILVFIFTDNAQAKTEDINCNINLFNKCTQVHEDGNNRVKCDVCDINKLLSPDLQPVQDIENVSDTKFKVTFKWKKPELLREQSGCGGKFVVNALNNAENISTSTRWKLEKYYLRIKKGEDVVYTTNFTPTDHCTSDASGVTSYEYELTLSQAPPDEGVEYTVEAFVNHHRTNIAPWVVGNDLWIFSQRQSFKITKDGGQVSADDYSPEITGAQAVISGSVGTARLQWKKPAAVINKKETLDGTPGYIFRRKKVEGQKFFSQENLAVTNFTDLEGSIVSGDDKAIDMKDLSNGECREYEYFVKANYKQLGSNVGLSPNGRMLKFCKDDDGTYSGQDEGATEGVSPQNTTQATGTGGSSGSFDCGCDKEKFGDFIPSFDTLICEVLCWVFNMFINFVTMVSNWAKVLPM